MKKYLMLFLLLVGFSAHSQDFKFNGTTSLIVKQYFNLGNDVPVNQEEIVEKEAVSFDGRQLTINKEIYKYVWHQKSKEDDTMQLNCIVQSESGEFPYNHAIFELDYVTDDQLKIKQYLETSPTTLTLITYTVEIKKSGM